MIYDGNTDFKAIAFYISELNKHGIKDMRVFDELDFYSIYLTNKKDYEKRDIINKASYNTHKKFINDLYKTIQCEYLYDWYKGPTEIDKAIITGAITDITNYFMGDDKNKEKEDSEHGLIEGYKAFKRTVDGRLFTDHNGRERTYFEEGETYEIDKAFKIKLCENGFHFCRKLSQLLNFNMLSPSMAYCKVQGICKNKSHIDEDELKLCVRKIKIVEELNWDEVLQILQTEWGNQGQSVFLSKYLHDASGVVSSDYVQHSMSINESDCVCDSTSVASSMYVDESSAVMTSHNISNSQAVKNSNTVFIGNAIYGGNLIFDSSAIEDSDFIIDSECVRYSKDISNSYTVSNSKYVYISRNIANSVYVYNSAVINDSKYIANCSCLNNCLFCYGLSNKSSHIFNKEVSAKRFSKIHNDLLNILDDNNWKVNFSNHLNFKPHKAYRTLFDFEVYQRDKHFKDFPKEAIEYLKALSEFDAKIFKKITNIKLSSKKQK